jgi:signal transduction histidine kinase
MLKDAGLPETLTGILRGVQPHPQHSRLVHADDSVRDCPAAPHWPLSHRAGSDGECGHTRRGTARGRSLARANESRALTVTDDGKGFRSESIGGLRGLGLINMRERARQLNGTFELTSEPGQGTTVRVTIPFRRAV